jgi:hypothetical protein
MMGIGRIPKLRGRLTPEEKKRIEDLAEKMGSPTAGKIAAAMNRQSSTIHWYMLKHGLVERAPGRAPRPYMRNGKMIHPYAPEHDSFIEKQRANGLKAGQIADAVTAEFGIERNAHSVEVRLVQLAAAPEA